MISRFAAALATRISPLSVTIHVLLPHMVNPLVLVPARMASTRLPGKPLADIRGEPMIVHVWRRAIEADVGPVVVATDDAARRPGGGTAGGRAAMTRADHPSGSDRIFEALGAIDPDGVYDVVVNVQGDLPTIERSAVRACLAPLDDAAVDIATLATPIVRGRGEGRSQRRQGGRRRDRAAPAAGALFHPRPRALGRGRSFCTTSASTPIGAAR